MAAADNGRTTVIAARLALLLAGALLVVGMRAAAGAGVGPMSVQALAGPELLSDAHLRGFIESFGLIAPRRARYLPLALPFYVHTALYPVEKGARSEEQCPTECLHIKTKYSIYSANMTSNYISMSRRTDVHAI